MRLRIAEDDAALRDAAAYVLAKEVTAETVRDGWQRPGHGSVAAVWRRLAEVGVTGTLVAEAAGGLGLDENALPPLLEAFGHWALPVPVVETVAVAAPLLAAARAPQLPDVLAGRRLVAIDPDGSGLVPFGGCAGLLVLPAGDTLRLYERAEVRAEGLGTVDGSRAMARVTAPPTGGLLLCEGARALAAARRRGVLGTAALLLGLGGRMLELTVEHVRRREQFGVPVGSFQAVKHALADTALALRFARPAVLAAGWSLATGDDQATVRTSMAKVLASEAARKAARTAVQCHGATGCTTAHPLHLYAKRAWALSAAWGDPADHRALLARELRLTREEARR